MSSPQITPNQNLPLSPYNGGINVEGGSIEIDDRECLVAENFIITPSGPKKRPPVTKAKASELVDYPPIIDIISYWKLDGTKELLVVDQKQFYRVGSDGSFTPISADLALSGTLRTNMISRGDCEDVNIPSSMFTSGYWDYSSILSMRTSAQVYSGTYAWLYKPNSYTSTNFYSFVSSASGKNSFFVPTGESSATYRFSCWVYVDTDADKISDCFIELYTAWSGGSQTDTDIASVGNQWVQLSTELSIPSDFTDFYARIYFPAEATSPAVTAVYMDDVELTITVRSKSIILNESANWDTSSFSNYNIIIDSTYYSIDTNYVGLGTPAQMLLLDSDIGSYPSGTSFGSGLTIGPYGLPGVSRPYPDWVIVPDPANTEKQIVIADGKNSLLSYNGSTVGLYGTGNDFVAGAVGFIAPGQNRLFAGYIYEDSTYWRQRIRWTRPLTPVEFETGGGDTYDDFQDIPVTSGEILRILPLGELLVLYFNDAIVIGRPTGRTDLPFDFSTKLETGNKGLIGQKAVYPWNDGHFVVMQDNIYFLAINGSLQPIGSKVVKNTIRTCQYLERVWVTADPENDRMLFGFPESTTAITKIWSYNYKAKAWSYDTIGEEGIYALAYVEHALTTGSLDSNLNFTATADKLVFAGDNDELIAYQPGSTATGDFDTPDAVTVTLISKDYDLKLPDKRKSALRLSLKIDEPLSADLDFAVYISSDRGSNYQCVTGTTASPLTRPLRIPAGDDEAYCNFSVMGSTLRFKLVSSSLTEPYTIENLVFRVKLRDQLEANLGSYS